MNTALDTRITGPAAQALIALTHALQRGPVSVFEVQQLGISNPKTAFKALRYFRIETDVSIEWVLVQGKYRAVRYWTLRKTKALQ